MRPLLALTLAAALAGCDALSFSDEPFTEVDPTAAPFTVDLAAADTVGLWGTASLSFGVQGGPVRRVEVLLDGEVVATQDGPGPVAVPTAGRADGEYALVFRAYGSPGTGSLADKLGRETVLAEVERMAIVDNAPPTPVELVGARPEGGFLTVEWEQYPRHNFQTYAVRDGGYYDTWNVRDRIGDRRKTTWADPTYLGGERIYSVVLEAGGQTVASGPMTVDYPVPTLAEAVPGGGGRVRITWHATPFTGAFKSYALFRNTSYYDPPVVKTTEAAADTVAVDQVEDVFGRPYEYLLRTYGRAPNTDVFSTFSVYTDPASPLGGRVAGVPGGGVLGVDVGTRRLALRDARTLALWATASLPEGASVLGFAASPAGRVGALASWGNRTYAVELDGTTLQTLHQADVTAWVGPDGRLKEDPESRIFFTDGGTLIFGVEPRGYYAPDNPTLIAIDVAAGRRVGGAGGYQPAWPIAASGDGRYVVAGQFDPSLYERDASTTSGYRLVAGLADTVRVDGAAFLSPTRLAVLTNTTPSFNTVVEVLALPSLERVSRFVVDGEGYTQPQIAADAGSGQIAVYSGAKIHVYDVFTGDKITAFAADAPHWLSLAGGAVWGNSRYRRLP